MGVTLDKHLILCVTFNLYQHYFARCVRTKITLKKFQTILCKELQ